MWERERVRARGGWGSGAWVKVYAFIVSHSLMSILWTCFNLCTLLLLLLLLFTFLWPYCNKIAIIQLQKLMTWEKQLSCNSNDLPIYWYNFLCFIFSFAFFFFLNDSPNWHILFFLICKIFYCNWMEYNESIATNWL